MTDKEILEIFEEFKNDYYIPKSSESSRIISFFCLYIQRQDAIVQQLFKDFFIRELATNTYNNQDWAVGVLMKLNDSKLISDIFCIFSNYLNKERNYENTLKKGRIFLLLVRLRDCDANHAFLYYDFIEKEVKKQVFLNQNAFFLGLLVEYLIINPQHSLSILSDYYATFISVNTTRNESNIFIPCLFFSQNSCFYMKDLILTTYDKSKQSGLYLKKLFLDFAKHTPVNKKKEWKNMQNMILQLESINLISLNR